MNVEAVVREALEHHVEVPEDADAPLGLSSLAVVQLTEALEEELDFVVRADELSPEHFSTLARLVAFVRGKLGA
ncbi:MAG: acyl carrier protein [Myxococcales bacterium]|nr:acyl carrier protein [Myxococcales bacterium]